MADWSQLPKDLLHLIAKRLETCFDIIHFRSVCTAWRSYVPPTSCLLPASFQLTRFDEKSVSSFDIYKSIIVLIRFPKKHNQATPDRWLVKIKETVCKELQLWNPLSNSWITGPMLLDLLNCQVIELSQEYVVHRLPHQLQDIARYNTRKVAFMWSNIEKNDYVMLKVNCCGNFVMLRSRDKQWTILENTPRSCRDIISFNGKFYALVEEGKTMVVEPSSNVSFLAHVGFLGHVGFHADVASRTRKKFLVESGGELLLVDQFLLPTHLMNMGFGVESSMCSPLEMVWFKVFKLNEAAQKWEYVKSLDDHVLFLGKYSAFSASASQLSWSKGSYIFFRLNNFEPTGAEEDMYVFNYENGSIRPFKKYPDFFKLFRPPGEWVITSKAQ